MKKVIGFLLIVAFLSVSQLIYSAKISVDFAERVAKNYTKSVIGVEKTLMLYSDSTNRITQRTSAFMEDTDSLNQSNYYVFRSTNNKGFVIVSADNVAKPILGYSDSADFGKNNPNFEYWMNCLSKEIDYAIQQNLPQSSEISDQWESLSNETTNLFSSSIGGVEPLIQTKWNQGTPYNNDCPTLSDEKTITGCVATAMAQMMNYHQWPKTGFGSNTYTHSSIGTISANFEATTYDWNNMLTTYSAGNYTEDNASAVAKLMFHCGVSVDMDYGIDASSASNYSVYQSLMNHFEYDTIIKYIFREDLSDLDWANSIQVELDQNRPILYRGDDGFSGHAFICDGYDANGLFHFNWGWGGYEDGYYQLEALDPGSSTLNEDQAIITGIKPSTDSCIIRGTNNQIEWYLKRGGTLYIEGRGGLTINSSTEVPWYTYRKLIKKVVIENGVTSICNYAFWDCSNLSSVSIPLSVTTIESYAFLYCTGLTSITLPSSVTTIGDFAFYGCDELKSVINLSTTPQVINSYTFYQVSLYNIKLIVPMNSKAAYKAASIWKNFDAIVGVDSIGAELTWFVGYPNKSSIYAQLKNDTLKIVGNGTMQDYTYSYSSNSDTPWWELRDGIKSIIIEEGVTTIGSASFYDFDDITSVSFPKSLTTIGRESFYDCDNLYSITILENVTSIGSRAFDYCSDLEEVTNLSTTPQTIDNTTFYSYNLSSSSLTVPESALSAYYLSAIWNNFGNITGIDSTGTIFTWHIGNTNRNSIEATLKEDSLHISGSGAMQDFSWSSSASTAPWWSHRNNISRLTVDEGITSVGAEAFNDCVNLHSICLPNTLTTIGHDAFYGCLTLTSINIPKSIVSVGSYAFAKCSELLSVINQSATPQSIYSNVFYNITLSTKTLYVPTTSLSTYQSASVWKNFGSIVGVDSMGSSLTWHIGTPNTENVKATLHGNTMQINGVGNMQNYVWNNTASSAPWWAIRNTISCIIIEDGILTIGDETFDNCKNLTSVTIPNSVTQIGHDAFYGCSLLPAITLPVNLTVIGSNAFYGCLSLLQVHNLKTKPQTINNTVFGGINLNEAVLIVPYGSAIFYQSADVWKDFGTIKEQTSTGNRKTEELLGTISGKNGILRLQGFRKTEKICIYNAAGLLIKSFFLDGYREVNLQKNQLYLVKISNFVYKISL